MFLYILPLVAGALDQHVYKALGDAACNWISPGADASIYNNGDMDLVAFDLLRAWGRRDLKFLTNFENSVSSKINGWIPSEKSRCVAAARERLVEHTDSYGRLPVMQKSARILEVAAIRQSLFDMGYRGVDDGFTVNTDGVSLYPLLEEVDWASRTVLSRDFVGHLVEVDKVLREWLNDPDDEILEPPAPPSSPRSSAEPCDDFSAPRPWGIRRVHFEGYGGPTIFVQAIRWFFRAGMKVTRIHAELSRDRELLEYRRAINAAPPAKWSLLSAVGLVEQGSASKHRSMWDIVAENQGFCAGIISRLRGYHGADAETRQKVEQQLCEARRIFKKGLPHFSSVQLLWWLSAGTRPGARPVKAEDPLTLLSAAVKSSFFNWSIAGTSARDLESFFE